MHQVTGTNPDVLMMLLADARLPTGGHTQSGGLEPALRSGMPAGHVPAYVAARLATTARVEAGTAVVARHVALTASAAGGPVPGDPTLDDVCAAWAARTPSAALREASARLGRGHLRLLRRLWAGHAALAALERALAPRGARQSAPRAVVLGVLAACAGLDAVRLARLVAYDDAQTVAAASLKLAPGDPAETTAWLLAAGPDVDDLVAEVAHLTRPDQIPAHGAPLVEQWAELHVRTTERLFHA